MVSGYFAASARKVQERSFYGVGWGMRQCFLNEFCFDSSRWAFGGVFIGFTVLPIKVNMVPWNTVAA